MTTVRSVIGGPSDSLTYSNECPTDPLARRHPNRMNWPVRGCSPTVRLLSERPLAVRAIPSRSVPPQANGLPPRPARLSRSRLSPAPFELDEWKLHAPPERQGIVERTAIVDRLASADQPVIAITAPAGYGKTTVLGQWALRKGPRTAWLSIDDRDNDPAVLLTYLAVALDRVERIEPQVFRSLGAPGGGISDLVRLMGSMAAMDAPVHLALDHAEALTSRECRDLVVELAVRLPPGSQLAIAAREQVLLPLPRLRAQGAVIELDAVDLALESEEAHSLLSGAGLRLDREEADALAARTEGWPAGLYLAALAINAGSSHTEVVRAPGGDDRFIGDYLRAEFLEFLVLFAEIAGHRGANRNGTGLEPNKVRLRLADVKQYQPGAE